MIDTGIRFSRSAARVCIVIGMTAVFGGIPMVSAGNLLQNGGFEWDEDGDGVADGWYLSIHADAGGYADLQPGSSPGAGQCQHLVHENASREWVRTSIDNIHAVPDTSYRISGRVRATGSWSILLYEFPTGNSAPYTTHTAGHGTACDWTTVSKVIHTLPTASSFKVSLVTAGAGEAWFDDLFLENLSVPRTVSVPILEKSPEIDGDLSDDAWEKAIALQPFFMLGGNGETASVTCEVKVGMAEGNLFLAWRNAEPEMGKVKISEPPSWSDDTVEIFLAPDPQAQPDGYVQFGVTPAGGRLSSVKAGQGARRFYTDWFSQETTVPPQGLAPALDNLAWQVGVQRGENGWTAEAVIPLTAICGGRLPPVCGFQLARSRKIGGTEENSCWSLTEGTTFHRPARFGQLFPAAPTSPDPAFLPEEPFELPPLPPLVPAPREFRSRRGGLKWPGPILTVDGISGEDGHLAKVLEYTLSPLGIDIRPAGPRDRGKAITLRLEVVPPADFLHRRKLQDWQRVEAYELDTVRFPCTIRGETVRGIICGIQTFRQLLVPAPDGFRIHRAEIRDWPGMQWRGWHLIGPQTGSAVNEAMRVIDTLAGLKLNWLAVQIDNRLQYDFDPELGCSGAPTKAQLAALVARGETYGIEMIPMTQCLSHFTCFLRNPKYRALAEIPEPPDNSRHKYWNYCPRNPACHEFINTIIGEQLECFPNARYFHVGLDEITFEPIGVCPRCQGASGGLLLAEEIQRLHDFLLARGLRMCMWGDQLLEEHNGGPPQRTAEALPAVPRDVVIFDWHYSPQESFPSLAFFKSKGFDVMACGWYEPLNISRFSETACRENALGYGGTTWYGIDRIRAETRLIDAMPLAAELTWHAAEITPARVTYRPGEVFQALYDPVLPRAERVLPLDLSTYANRSLTDTELGFGCFGLGPEYDFRDLPTGTVRLADVPFRIPSPSPHQCLVLADAGGELGGPEAAMNIAVGTNLRELAFLHTCSRPKRFSRHIYDRSHINPGIVMRYDVHYADGITRSIPIRWNLHISDWNSQLGSAYGRTAWQTTTSGGALARLEAYRWINPRPEVAVRAIDIISGMDTVNPMVVAITAIVGPGREPMPEP